jgi:hypothetical protein
MHTKDPGTPTDPGNVPEAVAVHDGNPATGRPGKPTTWAGKLLAVLHGDAYMANAYPPEWRDPAATSAANRP